MCWCAVKKLLTHSLTSSYLLHILCRKHCFRPCDQGHLSFSYRTRLQQYPHHCVAAKERSAQFLNLKQQRGITNKFTAAHKRRHVFLFPSFVQQKLNIPYIIFAATRRVFLSSQCAQNAFAVGAESEPRWGWLPPLQESIIRSRPVTSTWPPMKHSNWAELCWGCWRFINWFTYLLSEKLAKFFRFIHCVAAPLHQLTRHVRVLAACLLQCRCRLPLHCMNLQFTGEICLTVVPTLKHWLTR